MEKHQRGQEANVWFVHSGLQYIHSQSIEELIIKCYIPFFHPVAVSSTKVVSLNISLPPPLWLAAELICQNLLKYTTNQEPFQELFSIHLGVFGPNNFDRS